MSFITAQSPAIVLNARMEIANVRKTMRKMRLTFVSLMHDMRTLAPWLVGGYWLLIVLIVAYWAL